MKPADVLVVDDLADWRATFKGLLVDAGFVVQVASSKAEAMALLSSQEFPVAVVDMRLDDSDESNIDGLKLAEDVLNQGIPTKVILVTGYGSAKTIDRAMEPNAASQRLVADYIPKTEISDIAACVARLLAEMERHDDR
jgi:DNA-binding NtrC family response regulator